MTHLVAVDTSVAIPLVVASHPAHGTVTAWAGGKGLRLAGHAFAETYAVLTRLPGGARLAPIDAATLIDANFGPATVLDPGRSVHRVLAALGVAGGATYDGLVALAADTNGLTLATRDARARATYEAVGVTVELVAS